MDDYNKDNYDEIDIQDKFELSGNQLFTLNRVFLGLVSNLRKQGMYKSAELYEERGDIFLEVEGLSEKIRIQSKDFSRILKNKNDNIKYIVLKTVDLLSKYISVTVKRVKFSLEQRQFSEGVMLKSTEEEGSVVLNLR